MNVQKVLKILKVIHGRDPLKPDKDHLQKTCLHTRKEIGDVERMLKAMIKSLENKHLDP